MFKSLSFQAVCLTMLLTPPGYSQEIPFDSEQWDIRAQESRIVNYLGRQSLFMKGGIAWVEDSDFKNGSIEFEVAFTGERGFMGAVWRKIDSNNFEEFYMRPHQTGKPDANQYTPIFNGAAAWQLYHGDGYGAPVEYPFNEWLRVRIVVGGSRGEVYIEDMDKPAVIIHEMKHEIQAGQVGLMCANFAPAYFSNFRYSTSKSQELKGRFKHQEATAKGTVAAWSISNAFDEKSLDAILELSEADKSSLTWTELQSEPSGITNLARVQGIAEGKNTAFARIILVSDRAQVKKLQFGYSDRLKVFFNDRLLYGGSNFYRSRDYRYLGTIGYFDELYLPLVRGDNELWLAVSEDFGGWGIQAKFEDMSGLQIKPK